MTHTLPIQVIHQQIGGGSPVDITPWITDLEFRSTSPGGYASATFTLNLPLVELPIQYTQYSLIDIVDTATSNVLWQGHAEDPDRHAGPDGESFRITATGVCSTLQDIKRPYNVIDTKLDSFAKGAPPITLEACQMDVDADENVGGPGWLLSIPAGTTAPGPIGYLTYEPMTQSGQLIGSICLTDIQSGQTTEFAFGVITATGIAVQHVASSAASPHVLLAGVHFGDTAYFHASWEKITGAPQKVGDDCWCRFGNVIVKAKLLDKFGSVVIAPPTTYTYWLEILGDILGSGWWMLAVDGPTAIIDIGGPAPVHIPQFAFPDGVTAQDILDELLLKEPGYTWLITNRLINGKHQFVWVRRPGVISFDVDLAYEGIDCPGGVADLFNAVTVRWKDQMSNTRSQRFTSSVPMLTAAGLVREEIIDLGDNVESNGSTVASTAAAFLAEHAFPTRSGTLTVSRPLFNMTTDQFQNPWTLTAPFLVRIASGAIPDPPGDVRDGVTVFECVAVTYRTSDATAVLDLEETPRFGSPKRGYDPRRRS